MAEETFVAAKEEQEFSAMLDTFFDGQKLLDRCLARGRIVRVTDDDVLVEVHVSGGGYVTEGFIPLKEFSNVGDQPPAVGEVIDVFIERFDGRDGGGVLSYEQAVREAAWGVLEKAFENEEAVEGVLVGRVRGGFSVSLRGVTAFMPSSQIDIRPVKDPTHLIGVKDMYRLLRLDRSRNNIVVSRRAVIEAERFSERAKLFENLKEGQIVRGKVKNLTDYGAFVDLGGVDGLLHSTDMSWGHVADPRKFLALEQVVDVKVIRFNKETGRISLGLKHLEEHPWNNIEKDCPVGSKLAGKVTSVVDYGAFVEVKSGVEGLVHVSEMSWQKGNIDPRSIVSDGQEVEVVVLEIDSERRRLALSMRRCQENPWEKAGRELAPGGTLDCTVEEVVSAGLRVKLPDGAEGFIYADDISWKKAGPQALQDYKKGDALQAKVLRVDPVKEQIILGVKHLSGEAGGLVLGSVVTCEVKEVKPMFLAVACGPEGALGEIRKADLSSDRAMQRTDRFSAGERVDAKVISCSAGKIRLSIRERESDEAREVMKTYGSSQSGATLREILGNPGSSKKPD